MKKPRSPTSLRWPTSLLARAKAYAAEHNISVSSALRIAAQRGLVLMESEAAAKVAPSPPAQPEPLALTHPEPRRRILSPGVDR